jgi:hypothetical protein
MADKKLTDITTELEEVPHDDDLIHVVDVSDTTDDATGTSKKWKIITWLKTLFALDADVIKKDGSVDYTGSQSMNNNDIEDVNQIDVSGYIELPEDDGISALVDLPQNSAVEDAEQSYTLKIGGTTILKIKALADGAGGIKEESVEVEGVLNVTGQINAEDTVNLAEGTASKAPLKFTSGTLLTTPEEGVMEYYDGKLYITKP